MTTRQEALDILVKLEEQMKSHGLGLFLSSWRISTLQR